MKMSKNSKIKTNLKVYTINIETANRLGLDYLDISNWSGQKVFAPTWSSFNLFKQKRITQREYKRQYVEKMRRSYSTSREVWAALLNEDKIILGCYCPSGAFCHRRLLSDILVKCGATSAGEIEEFEHEDERTRLRKRAFACVHEAGISDADFKWWVQVTFGVQSRRELTEEQWSLVIAKIETGQVALDIKSSELLF